VCVCVSLPSLSGWELKLLVPYYTPTTIYYCNIKVSRIMYALKSFNDEK